jgi:hypothetical protein
MCGPSSALKAINSSIQDFAGKVKDEAGEIFGDASQVFNTVMNSVKGIVSGGPSQFGYSQGEYSAKTAAAVNAGAAEARNLKGAAASSAAAVGGGNVATPAGATQATVLSADQKAAADTASAENAIVQEGYAKGYDEWKTGLDAAEKAPNVFATANEANSNVTKAQHEAETSQTNIDSMSNWAMNDIMKLGTAAVSGLTSGATGGISGGIKNLGNGSFMDNIKSFGSGFMGKSTN